MKKLMALCLSVLMVLSMVSFTVMAEGAVDFSAIANGQPAKFVTGNLVLGENTITSSNEAVIATDGTVTRPLFGDATVSLTINGGEAFDVVVKSKETNVLYSEDFGTAAEATKSGSNWVWTGAEKWYASSSNNGGSAVANGKFTVNHTDGSGRVWLYHTPAALVSNEKVVIRFDSADITGVGTGIDIRIDGKKYDADGNQVGALTGVTVSRLASSGWGGYWMGAYRTSNVEIKYDPMTGEFWGNGVLNATKNLFEQGTFNTGKTDSDVAKVVITSMYFVDAADSATGIYSIDNFVEYQEVPAEEVLATATPAEKLGYYAPYLEKDYIAPGADFSAFASNLNLTPDEELVDGVSITWTSTNPEVVPASGVLNRPMEGETAVTLTGTLTVEGAEPVVKTYSINVLPLTVSYKSEVVDAENLTAGTSFVGATGWTSSIKSWERMDVGQDADGNKYFSICASSYQPSGTAPKYTFQTVPTYTMGETFVFEAKVRVPVKKGLANWGFLLNGSEIAEFIYYNNYLYDNDYDLGSDNYYGAGAARTDKNITANTWYKITIEAYKNADGSFVKCYIDDKLCGQHKAKNAIPATITSAAFQFTGRSNMDSTKDAEVTTPVVFFDIDDISLTKRISDEAAVQLLADSDKVAYYKKLISANPVKEVKTAGEAINLDAAYELMDSAVTGVTVAWTSSNTEYITNAGEVLKLTTVDAPVTVNLTATITAGDATDTVVIPVRIGDGTTLLRTIDFNTSEGENYVQDSAEHGTVLYLKNETAGKHAQKGFDAADATRGDRVMLEADIKYESGEAAGVGGFTFNLIAGRLSAYVSLHYNSKMIGVHTTTANVNSAATGFDIKSANVVYYPMPASVIEKGEGEWVHVAVDHNSMSQSLYVYVDGVLLNELPLLQAEMDLGSNSGAAVRGYSIQLSGAGKMWVDNITYRKLDDATETEVDAALNAALIDYASEINKPVLTNCTLPAMTIGKSWINGTSFIRDLNGSAIKPTNVSTYTYVTDGPAITWTVDGQAATAIDVDSPKVVTITVTAAKNGISKSKTFTKKVAPISIRELALGTADCLNGAWVEGATGTEKLIMALYQDDVLVQATVIDFAATGEWDSETGTGSRFDVATGRVHDLGTQNPKVVEEYDQIKLFVVAADGITPLATANADLHD